MQIIVTKTFKYDDHGRVIEETIITEKFQMSYPVYPIYPVRHTSDWTRIQGTMC